MSGRRRNGATPHAPAHPESDGHGATTTATPLSPMERRLRALIEHHKDQIEARDGVRPDAVMIDDDGFADHRQLVRCRPHYLKYSLPESASRAIARRIAQDFECVVARYDTVKYPPAIYLELLQRFGEPARVRATDIRLALVWKYGHVGKPRIPGGHERFAGEIWRAWPRLTAELPYTARDVFNQMERLFGGPKRFITVAFLTHLMFPNWVPIIDQHNFRAVNQFMRSRIPAWPVGLRPTGYYDLDFLSSFMRQLLVCWPTPAQVPTPRALDLYLMMRGAWLKQQARMQGDDED